MEAIIMVRQQFTVTCPTCSSSNVSFKEKSIVLTRQCVTDFSLNHHYYTPSTMEQILECHCNNCTHNFKESLGIQYIPLMIGEIEV